jgi:RNA polymerase sigma factor (sigma-70 family)
VDKSEYFTADEERSLIRAAQGGDTVARDRLLLGALPFVRKGLARRYPWVEAQDFEDMVHESISPLLGCINRYDLDHPARARFYVFAASYIHKAVLEHFRHRSVLVYQDELPELESEDDPEAATATEQAIALTRRVLEGFSGRDRDVLYSRFGDDKSAPRRELAERHHCSPDVIQYAEQKAIDRFVSIYPLEQSLAAAAIN